MGWVHSSFIKHLQSMHEDLGLSTSTTVIITIIIENYYQLIKLQNVVIVFYRNGKLFFHKVSLFWVEAI
jgi:hypothetical protein